MAKHTNNGAADAPGTPPAAVMAPDSAREPVAAPERSGGGPGASQNGGTSTSAPKAVMAGKRMVAAGEPGDMKKTWCYPTLAQRVQASEMLLRKLLPDLKATELTGKDGAPLTTSSACSGLGWT